MTVTEIALLRLPPSLLNHTTTTTTTTNNDNNNPPSNTARSTLPPKFKHDLLHAQTILSSSSTHPFTFHQCVEDETLVFILGSWASVKFHRDEFLPSEANAELLRTLVDGWGVGVEWMFHVDVDADRRADVEQEVRRGFDQRENQKGQHGGESEPKCTAEGVIAITRCGMSSKNREGFTEVFDRVKGWLLDFVGGEKRACWGFRVDEKENISFDAGGRQLEGQHERQKSGTEAREQMTVEDDASKNAATTSADAKEEFVLFSAWKNVDAHMAFAQSQGFAEYMKIRDFVDLGIDLKHGVRMVLD